MAFGKLGAMGRGFGTLGALGSAGVSYDSDAQAIFAAFTTPPDAARKALINAYVAGLKADGVWAVLDVLYVMAAADSQAATINWRAPASFALVGVNSPGFTTDRGYTGNGTSSRLRTQYTPSVNGVNYTQDSSSCWLFSLSNTQSNNNDIGSATAPRVNLNVRNATDQSSGDINNAAGVTMNVSNTNGIGFFGIQRRAAADRRLWANGTQLGATSTTASTAVASQEQWVCGTNSATFSARQQAVAAWGASLAGLESAFYNRTLTYLQAVGAQ